MEPMMIQGWLLSTYAWPRFVVVKWEWNYSMVDCTGFDNLGRFCTITITREEFATAKSMKFELSGIVSLGG